MHRSPCLRSPARAFLPAALLGLLALLAPPPTLAQPGTGTHRVDVAVGVDSGSCGAVATPCLTIQQAVKNASNGDTILVAKGTYTHDPTFDGDCPGGAPTVVCVLNRTLTLQGGFPGGGDWGQRDPDAHPTLIDGEDLNRGIFVQSDPINVGATTIEVDGFTIKRGFDQGATSGPDIETFGFGGGMSVLFADTVVRHVVFSANRIFGGNTGSGKGGSGAGGGLSLRATSPHRRSALLEQVTFTGNTAQGGTGPQRGGLGLGGGLFTNFIDFTGNGLIFRDNIARAGDSAGPGADGVGLRADALGGGAAFEEGSVATLAGVEGSGNEALGGDASNGAGGLAGGAFGGALFAELATMTVRDADLRDNLALGGAADQGGSGDGGAVMATKSTIVLDRVLLIDNRATGGAGITREGPAGGGGAYFSDRLAAETVTMKNCIVADNLVSLGSDVGDAGGVGGGGGAVFLSNGIQLVMSHCTLARNQLDRLPLQGHAIVVVNAGNPAIADVDYTIIADHTAYQEPNLVVAVHVHSGATLNLERGLWAGNFDDHNDDNVLLPAGTITGLGTMLSAPSAGFVSPGAPNFDYHLLPASAAVDQAVGSVELLDIDGQSRNGVPEIGADELGIFADGFESGNTSRWSLKVP